AQAVALEDAAREAAGRVPAYARLLPLHAALGDDGQWTTLANGDGIWRIRVVSTGALATELYFSDFFLPEEAELHVYTADGGHVLGGFTAFNNREDGSFATSIIRGESCLVEYHVPAAVRGEGRFTIFSIGRAYRDVDAFRDISSGPCHVDVNCSEGEDWPEQRDAVVRI